MSSLTQDDLAQLVTDDIFLSQKSKDAELHSHETDSIAAFMSFWLYEHIDICVGIAANMFGYDKRIITVYNNQNKNGRGAILTMINPVVLNVSPETYEAEEGCMVHEGTKKVTRHKKITVKYYRADYSQRTKTFSGITAQSVQHQLDHLNGVLI